MSILSYARTDFILHVISKKIFVQNQNDEVVPLYIEFSQENDWIHIPSILRNTYHIGHCSISHYKNMATMVETNINHVGFVIYYCHNIGTTAIFPHKTTS